VSRAITQLSSRRRTPVQEELHAGYPGLQPGERSGTLGSLFVERLDDNPDALVLAEIEIARGLEGSVRIDGLGESRHGNAAVRLFASTNGFIVRK
jgi:hypothetical protein